MTLLLELNDAGVRVHRDGAVAIDSPGYVHIDRKTVLVGEAARQHAKLDPTRTENEFWQRLSRDELKQRNRVARYQADLAYLHLESLWKEADLTGAPVIAAVPGDYSKEQIALLLGMLRRLEAPVSAVVDLGVAGSTRPRPGRTLLHLDVHLHRAVLTAFEQGAVLDRIRTRSTREVGLVRLLDAWAFAVAGVFVRHTRFDPMHDAAVEQSLYDQLLGWADLLSDRNELAVALHHGGRHYEAELHRRDIVAAAEGSYRLVSGFVSDELPADKPVTLQLTDRAARIPGLSETLARLPEVEIVELPADSASAGLDRLYLPRQSDGGVPYVTSKPWFDRDSLDRHVDALATFRRTLPTHVLVGARARPLGDSLTVGTALNGSDALILEDVEGLRPEHLELRREGDQVVVAALSDGETLINGVPAQPGQAVAAGDWLRVGSPGAELLLIAVDED